MNNDKTVDVVDWRPTPRSFVPARRRYASPTLIGIVGTVLIHSFIVPSAYWVSRGSKPRQPQTQDASLVNSKGGSSENLVLITLPTSSVSASVMASARPIQFSLTKKTMFSPPELEAALPDMEVLALDEDQPSASPGNGADTAEQARLFGIYSGQIRARIERIWQRPRTPVHDNDGGESPVVDQSFQCQVQVVQDDKGFVKEVLLPRCNGSPAWQRSLVKAVLQASPLPAPPSARVFSQSIVLDFVGLSYVKGSSEDGYEMEDTRSAQVLGPVAQSGAAELDENRTKGTPR